MSNLRYTDNSVRTKRYKFKYLSVLAEGYGITQAEYEKFHKAWVARKLPVVDLGGGIIEIAAEEAADNLNEIPKLKLGIKLTDKITKFIKDSNSMANAW